MVRRLHPSDMGTIVAGLPRGSRDAIVRVMTPETVAWMLRHMSPGEARRVSLRLGFRMLSFVLDQLHPQHALETLRRLPTMRAREVAETLKLPPPDTQLLAHSPDSAGALMVSQFPTVKIDGNAEAARDSVRALEEAGQKFTYVFVLNDGDELSGQVTMADLALAKSIVATVTVDIPAAECARLRRHYNLT